MGAWQDVHLNSDQMSGRGAVGLFIGCYGKLNKTRAKWQQKGQIASAKRQEFTQKDWKNSNMQSMPRQYLLESEV